MPVWIVVKNGYGILLVCLLVFVCASTCHMMALLCFNSPQSHRFVLQRIKTS